MQREVAVADVKFAVHESGPRLSLRVWDPDGEQAESFAGFDWFPLDPNYRVLVGHGLTDVQAPYFATAMDLARLPPFTAPDRLVFNVYPGGHMFYARDDSRKDFREEVRRMIEGK